MEFDPSAKTIASEDAVCSLCRANKALDVEVVRCVSASTWQLSWSYMYHGRLIEKKEEAQEITDPKDWVVLLCQECKSAQFTEANAVKGHALIQKMKGMGAGLIAGVLFGGLMYLMGRPEPRKYMSGQLDARAADRIGGIASTVISLVSIIMVVVCAVGILALFLAWCRRKVLARVGCKRRTVPASQRLLCFSQAAKHILSGVQPNTNSINSTSFPLPRVPTAADCKIMLPKCEHTLQMTKHSCVIQGQKWENLDDRFW